MFIDSSKPRALPTRDVTLEREAFERLEAHRDPADRNALFHRFLPLAASLAARYRHTSEPFEDLRQVASLGLLKAIERFDPGKGTAFSSFAVPTILGELRRHFRDTTWIVRVPRDLQDLANQLDRVSAGLEAELGRAPTPRELADHLKTSEERILEAREVAASHRASSLDEPVFDDDGGRATLGDLIGEADRGLERAEDAVTVQMLMRSLGEREREILRLRFDEDLKQSEIGDRLGISQMHVSRLIRQSIERLELAAASNVPTGTGPITSRPPIRLLAS